MLIEARIEFESAGATLRGYLLTPADATRHLPAVIMAHGTSATIQMVAIEYARTFARAGMAVVIYDHRNFGGSDGEPRQEINPWVQCRGYIDALDFASIRPEIDPERIGLWGDSYTGGQVVVVAACDARPKAIVGQCPVFGATVPPIAPSAETFAAIKATLLTGDIGGSPETTTGPLPVVSPDQMGSPSLLAPIQAFRWFIEYGGRPDSGWLNRATRVIPRTTVTYSPYLCAPYVHTNVLLMASPGDEMIHANYQVARNAFDLMPETKSWYDIAGGHFGLLYHPGALFDEAVAVQLQFLRRHLNAGPAEIKRQPVQS